MPESKTTIWNAAISVLVAICLALTGWGLSSIVELRAQEAECRSLVASHAERITSLEDKGSPALQKETAGNVAEHAALNKRIDETRADYGQRIQYITSLLERLVQQQTELIAYLKAKEMQKP